MQRRPTRQPPIVKPMIRYSAFSAVVVLSVLFLVLSVTASVWWLWPDLHQYFLESDLNGRPFDRDARSPVYERAKDVHAEYPFGTELDDYDAGYEWLNHSIAPKVQS